MSISLPTGFSRSSFGFEEGEENREEEIEENKEVIHQEQIEEIIEENREEKVEEPKKVKITSEKEEEEKVEGLEKTEEQLEAIRERTRKILSLFTPSQEKRYETYKRSNFKKNNMKTLLNKFTGHPINNTMYIVVGSMTKLFVGELVELARIIMEEQGEKGAIQPKHIREAHKRLKYEGKAPSKIHQKKIL